jgi:5'-3' exonuclease, N-terminal resolvase-like domain/T4 RNase H, C terminal
MILVDYSQVALAAILTFQRELKGTESEVKNLIRHVTLSTLKSYKKKYGKEYGEMVICCDGRKYWRREYFEHYKASRKKNRDNSDLDWHLIFDTLNEMRQDIAKNFPWRVIHVDRAEADDVIAVMTEYLQQNDLVMEGLVEEPQKVLILSSDKDFKQLQLAPYSSGNVRQWSPMQKKYITATKQEVFDFTVEHIVKGDTGDGIPNILSKDDVFVVGDRQKPVSAKRLAEFIEKGISACRNAEEIRNWQRNATLVAFDNIPPDVKESIITTYLSNKPTGDKMTVMNYLMEHRCRLLLEELEDF